jgi:hypothetical protein
MFPKKKPGGVTQPGFEDGNAITRQAFKDNLKMAEAYKKWAKAVA